MEKIIETLQNSILFHKAILHSLGGMVILFHDGMFAFKYHPKGVIMQAKGFKNDYTFTSSLKNIVEHLKGYVK